MCSHNDQQFLEGSVSGYGTVSLACESWDTTPYLEKLRLGVWYLILSKSYEDNTGSGYGSKFSMLCI